jgi:hypothetical protein
MQCYTLRPFTALMYSPKCCERRIICNLSVQTKRNEGFLTLQDDKVHQRAFLQRPVARSRAKILE